MKKNYVTPEMEEFKFEVPSLFQTQEAEGGQSGTNESGGGDSL